MEYKENTVNTVENMVNTGKTLGIQLGKQRDW